MRRSTLVAGIAAAACVVAATGVTGALLDGERVEAEPARTTTTAVERPTTSRAAPTTATAAPSTPAPVVPPATVPDTTVPPTVAPPAPPAAIATVLAGAEPAPATEPNALAVQLTEVETILRDPASPPEWVEAAAQVQQLAYRQLGVHPEWDAVVFAALPPPFLEAAVHQVGARREFRSMVRRPAENVPAWRVVDPLPAEELLGYYAEAEGRFGVPWYVLASVHLVETGMGRIVGLSSAGAQGPMQFIPGTWARYGLGGDVWDARDAILGAANYLAANGGADGTPAGLEHALFRYNNDNRYVRGVLHYAEVLRADPLAYRALHAWRIVYLSAAGDLVLPTGYEQPAPLPVCVYLATPCPTS